MRPEQGELHSKLHFGVENTNSCFEMLREKLHFDCISHTVIMIIDYTFVCLMYVPSLKRINCFLLMHLFCQPFFQNNSMIIFLVFCAIQQGHVMVVQLLHTQIFKLL